MGRDDNGASILHYAAAAGNINGINFAIRHCLDVNDRDHTGATPLFDAVQCYNFAPLESLLSNGADINAVCNNGRTILHLAVHHHNTPCRNCEGSKSEELMECLIKHGADVMVRGKLGESILHLAAAGRNITGINFAIRHGVDVNDRDTGDAGFTPLH